MKYNEKDWYACQHHDDTIPFITKLEFSKGYWWTVEPLQFKATSVSLMNLKKLNQRLLIEEDIITINK